MEDSTLSIKKMSWHNEGDDLLSDKTKNPNESMTFIDQWQFYISVSLFTMWECTCVLTKNNKNVKCYNDEHFSCYHIFIMEYLLTLLIINIYCNDYF